MIEGYPGRESVRSGDVLTLHVSTTAERFRADFYRVAERLEFAGNTPWFPGGVAPVPPHPDVPGEPASPAADWNWPAFTCAAPERPGLYLAVFVTEPGGAPPEGVRGFGREFFVVRPRPGAESGPILYKKSTFTRHAYNRADNGTGARNSSLYENPVYVRPGGHKVSMRRPGGVDDLSYWDAPFVKWLAEEGYAIDFCTDLDLHEDPELLDRYRLLLSVGHDEYWTEAMRTHAEQFVASGGNIAFFSANTCWWRTHVTDDGTAIVADTDHHVDGVFPHLPATDQWWPPDGAGRPENALTGVSFRNGGMWPGEWPGDRPRGGFAVQHAGHWAFAGTGLRDGADGGPQDFLGAGTPLIGYECDGAAFAFDAAGVARATGADGTPPSFLILGLHVLEPVADYYAMRFHHWNCPPREPEITSPPAATMGVHTVPGGGTVFTAATTDWPTIVGRRMDPQVERVTRNVLDRLGG
ncbi:N,N-dimethylformamidase beta subunit [Actinomadura rubteroloni]|uniref:N,N-dimethylformamidase beta subunit n=1 Tax=Actinomadura rubteroloni TaxID=1926885 RepID=A0A2P4UJS0_9ACTN|nr:N,N-dimethylformamidase beta subunit family domain-containing protein [Actinomadura rubteroloni]POM25291.1 N,N-dimethylformamidase beta subunit [Actinomadura rubteroloni]